MNKRFLNEDIKDKVQALEKAKEALKQTVEKTRKTCQHHFVVTTDYKSLEYMRSLLTKRMCLECRYEEEAESNFDSTSRWTRSNTVLGDSEERMVETVDRETFYSYRLPT